MSPSVTAWSMDPRTRELLDANIADMLDALGWKNAPGLRRLAAAVMRGPALRLAREMTAFDDEVSRRGLAAASGDLLAKFVERVTVRGLEHIPREGPSLLLSNHPGMTDTLVLLSSIPRADLRILAAERPFLSALRAASRSLIALPEDRAQRFAAMRRAVDHLRAGGALLTFPAGEIEPDPEVLPGAATAVRRWSASTLSFLRLVRGCVVVPMIVSGVLEPRAQRSPLVRLRRRQVDRERLAAMLQVLVHELSPAAWRRRVTLEVLPSLTAAQLPSQGGAAHAALIAVVESHLRRHARV